MNQTGPFNWREAFYAAVHDRDHGATRVTYQAADSLSRIPAELRVSRSELQEALLDLAGGQAAMAPVLRFCSDVWYTLQEEGVSRVIQHAKQWRNDLEASQKRFREELVKNPPQVHEGKYWALFSRSSNVLDGLEALNNAGLVVSDLIVGISDPGDEGVNTALKLKKQKLPITLVPDSRLMDLVVQGQVDRIILGCDAFDDVRFVNKTGSGALAALGNAHGIDVELWTTSHKMLTSKGVEWLDLSRYHGVARDPRMKQVSVDLALFGYGFLEHVTWMRTEEGRLSYRQIQDKIAELPPIPDALLAARERTRMVELEGKLAFTGN